MERAQTRNRIEQNKFYFIKQGNEYEMTMDSHNDFIVLKSLVIYYLN